MPIQAIKVFYLYVKFEIDWSNGFQVRVRKPHTDRQTDGQTDVGHINLIGGLVTRNPPKNVPKVCTVYSLDNLGSKISTISLYL